MIDPQTMLPVLQTVLAFCNIVILAYALMKFLNKPNDTLKDELKTLKVEIEALKVELKDIKQSLHQGNDRFREQDKTNEVIIRAVMALIRFEIHYCESEQKTMSPELKKADDSLNEYLSTR